MEDEYIAVASILDLRSCSKAGEQSGTSNELLHSHYLEMTATPPRQCYSSIPIEEMKRLMNIYGPELGNNRYTTAKPTPGSTARKFARWFPNFFHRFRFDVSRNQYVPVLGCKGERARRILMRQRVKHERNMRRKKNTKSM